MFSVSYELKIYICIIQVKISPQRFPSTDFDGPSTLLLGS